MPCRCAYQLRSPIAEVLNHLWYLGQGTLVLRQEGLSLAKSTPFGNAVTSREGGWNLMHDQLSGLKTNTEIPQNIYLLADGPYRRLQLAMGEPDKAIDLSIHLNDCSWDSPLVTELLRRFDGVSLDCQESRRLGAGAWMDEWGNATSHVSDGGLIREASHALRDCDWLEVEIKTSTHRSMVQFSPSFIDSEGEVLRVADKACKHVIYADVAAADFRLERVSASQIKIFKETVAA